MVRKYTLLIIFNKARTSEQFIRRLGVSSHGVLEMTSLARTWKSFTLNSRVDNVLVEMAPELNQPLYCFSSSMLWMSVWYTRSCVVAHIWQSTGSRSGLLGDHKSSLSIRGNFTASPARRAGWLDRPAEI